MKWYCQVTGDRYVSLYESIITEDGYSLRAVDQFEGDRWIVLSWQSIVEQSARVGINVRIDNCFAVGNVTLDDQVACVELIFKAIKCKSEFLYSSQYSPFEAAHTEGFREKILSLIGR